MSTRHFNIGRIGQQRGKILRRAVVLIPVAANHQCRGGNVCKCCQIEVFERAPRGVLVTSRGAEVVAEGAAEPVADEPEAGEQPAPARTKRSRT